MTESRVSEPDRTENRRQQILDAAADCFRCEGFHGASMAAISKSAKMSVGHIYNYFENKEAIILAIVELDVKDLLTVFGDLDRSDDILDWMANGVEHGFNRRADIRSATLDLEILAEAARNPKVGAAVQAADRIRRCMVIDTLRKGLGAHGRSRSENELVALYEVIAALFEGLSTRVIRNPLLDRLATLAAFKNVFKAILRL